MASSEPRAFSLKSFFDRALVERLGDSLAAAGDIDRARFVREACLGLESLELMDRSRHLARAMARVLPADFDRASELVLASLGPVCAATEGNGMAPFFYLPHLMWVAEHGLDHFETALALQHALTQRCSAEFSIRAFIEREPERTLARLADFATDPSEHVRRLVSEGTRPRLPWASRLRRLAADPRPVLPLLEALKDDPSPYVRRSVANHLNDIGKDHPELLLDVAVRWTRGASPQRLGIVRHALRSMVKHGDARALAILGFAGAAGIAVSGGATAATARIGESVAVEVIVRNDGADPIAAVVDLAVHFVKARGETRAKVFKLRDVALAPGESVALRKAISFRVHTTRQPYPGHHRIEALVNGTAFPLDGVDVR